TLSFLIDKSIQKRNYTPSHIKTQRIILIIRAASLSVPKLLQPLYETNLKNEFRNQKYFGLSDTSIP
ncbi:MAG: hypothetical protein ACR2LT_00675, partial [Pyrinomonadaceae bacterium]